MLLSMIRYILLGFLNYQPMTGYDLKQALDHSTAHFWHAHHSQIYTNLRQLEEEGLVTSQFVQEEGQPNRRIYSLTDAGKTVLKEWLDQPLEEMSPIKEELLVRIFFSGQRESKAIVAELEHQRSLHRQQLRRYENLVVHLSEEVNPPDLERDSQFWRVTVKLGLRYEQAYLEWLDETIRMVETL
jgi:DNA-binding PadR family transcriptional regulator